MFNKIFSRLFIGLCFAFIFGFTTYTLNAASPPAQTPLPTDCNECHESIQMHWEESAHGQAVTDEAFQEAWREAGEPNECMACHATDYDPETGTWSEEGVTCNQCHSLDANSSHHPEQIMPTDLSSRACGECHIDTHSDWEVSEHGQGELSCIRCHNPHTTSLKMNSVQEVCMACHNEEAYYYNYTAHADEGLLCTDCHLQVSDAPMGEGHAQREHTFNVNLETCNECHVQQMHTPTDQALHVNETEGEVTAVSNIMGIPPASGDEAADGILLAEQPAPSQSPVNFILPAGIGLLFGIMLTPWVERIFRRKNESNS